MSELDEKIRALLGDEQKLRQLLELAGAGKSDNIPAQQQDTASSAQRDIAAQAIDAAQLISSMLAQPRQPEPEPPVSEALQTLPPKEAAHPGGLAAMAEVLPPLLQAMSGDSSSLPAEKLNLIQAFKPYAASHCDSIDRAIKMACVAKAAKKALGTLGRL